MLKLKKLKKETKNIFFNCIFAALTLIIPILFYKMSLVTTILCLIVSIIGLLKWKSKLTLFIFVFGMFFGAMSEIVAIHFGVWYYSITNFMGIPLWLFIAWGNASAFIYQTAIEFERLGLHK